MRVRALGYLDQVISVDDQLWEAAKAAGTLHDLMDPILQRLAIELVFGEEGEFNEDL